MAEHRVLITGASRGIGRAVALRLARQGYAVAGCHQRPGTAAKQTEQDVRALGVPAYFGTCDVADPAAAARFIAAAEAEIGPVDLLVNNAGITRDQSLVLSTEQDWDAVLATNLTGTWSFCRSMVFKFMKNRSGAVVNMSSVAGIHGNVGQTAYAASKAGIIGLTKSLGKELAKTGIAVNCITPTTAKTKILDSLTPEFIEYMRVRIPRDRFAELDEIAAMVAWMLSEENSFTTAATFDLSGGRTTY